MAVFLFPLRKPFLFFSIYLISLATPALSQERAAWGLSQMQVGFQYSRSEQNYDYKTGNIPYYNYRTNVGYGLNGRIQASFLDLLLFGDGNSLNNLKFRIVDIIAFEGGMGYLKDQIDINEPTAVFVANHKTLWHNVGVEVGAAFIVRVIPTLDIGVKYGYLSHANATFGRTSYVQQTSGPPLTAGRSSPAYGNGSNWGFQARYRRIYGELNLIRDQFDKDLRLLSIFDLKYRFADHTTWASYIGIQFGGGTINSNELSNAGTGKFSRSWLQLSIGKMTNF